MQSQPLSGSVVVLLAFYDAKTICRPNNAGATSASLGFNVSASSKSALNCAKISPSTLNRHVACPSSEGSSFACLFNQLRNCSTSATGKSCNGDHLSPDNAIGGLHFLSCIPKRLIAASARRYLM